MARKGYVQLVNSFYMNWKVRKLRVQCPSALGVFAMVLSYCGDNLSDGRISRNDLVYVIGAGETEIAALLEVEMLVADENGDDYMVHDYLRHNRSNEQVTKKRGANADGYRKNADNSDAKVRETSDMSPLFDSESEVSDEKSAKTSDKSPKNESESGQTPEHQNTRTPEQINSLPPTPREAIGVEEDYSLDFEQFWQVYPRKEGKRPAFDAFRRAQKKTNKMTLIAKASQYANDPNREPRFTLAPANWLNGEHWLDQPQPARNTPPPQSKTAMNALHNAAFIQNLGRIAQETQQSQIGG